MSRLMIKWRILAAAVLVHLLLQVSALAPSINAQHTLLTRQAASLIGSPSPVVEHMLTWIRTNGGIVNVAVREVPGQGRITLAPFDLKSGDILAAIPKHVCFEAANSEVESAALLWQEMHNSTTHLAPYMSVLPSRFQVSSFYDMPESYFPLIQNDAMVAAIRQVQQQLDAARRQIDSKQAMAGQTARELGTADLRYTMSLLKTRAFDCGDLGELLVPVIDLANHHNQCKHSITSYKNCGPEAPGGCVVWRAGHDVPAGHEVCNSYHNFMLQDRSLLQYGMLQGDAAARMVSGVDRHDFNPQQPWAFQEGSDLAPFKGTHQQVKGEVARLTKLLAEMQALDRALQIQPDSVKDPKGELLTKLLAWRAQRKTAIAVERTRLLALLRA